MQYLLCHPEKLHSVPGEAQGAAAYKKLCAQLLLQLGYLLGEGLLGDEQMLGRHGYALLVGHGYEAF